MDATTDADARIEPYWTADELLGQIRAAVSLIAGETPPTDAEDLADRLLALDGALDELKLYRDTVHRSLTELAKKMPEPIVLAGHAWRVDWNKSRTGWQNDELRRAVSRIVLAVDDDGVVLTGAEVWETTNEAFRLGGGEARLTWLREHGIEPDEYCNATGTVASIRVADK